MKFLRRILPLFAALLLLSGCGQETDSELDQAVNFRTRLLGTAGCGFSAEITADYGDRCYTFSMDCQSDKDGTVFFTVTAPENIAGISGTVESGGGKLTFDDTALDFGILADGQVSPVTCPYMMVKTWRSGYISSAGQTEDGLAITFDSSFAEEPLTVELWLNDGGLPKYGEISYAGRRILSAKLTNFTFLSENGTE